MLFKASQEEFAFAVLKEAAGLGVQSRFDRELQSELSGWPGLTAGQCLRRFSPRPSGSAREWLSGMARLLKRCLRRRSLPRTRLPALAPSPGSANGPIWRWSKLLLRAKGSSASLLLYRSSAAASSRLKSLSTSRAQWNRSVRIASTNGAFRSTTPWDRPGQYHEAGRASELRRGSSRSFQSRWRDNYDVSRMLYDEFFNGFDGQRTARRHGPEPRRSADHRRRRCPTASSMAKITEGPRRSAPDDRDRVPGSIRMGALSCLLPIIRPFDRSNSSSCRRRVREYAQQHESLRKS